MSKELTEVELSEKYGNIEDKIPSVWPDYAMAGRDLARDLVFTWDVTDPELYRVVALVEGYVPGLRITQHLDPQFAFMGLYPNVQKPLNITPDPSIEQRKLDQQKREDKCGEQGGHYYLPSGGKYSPEGQKSCRECGKTIGN